MKTLKSLDIREVAKLFNYESEYPIYNIFVLNTDINVPINSRFDAVFYNNEILIANSIAQTTWDYYNELKVHQDIINIPNDLLKNIKYKTFWGNKK